MYILIMLFAVMDYLPAPLKKIIDGLKALPWIWEKSAQKYAFYLLKKDKQYLEDFWNALSTIKDVIRQCEKCHSYSEESICSICQDPKRDETQICVIENPFDILSIERPWVYKWVYHVLHWILSPIDGIGPNDLRINSLVDKVSKWGVREVIFAINPTLEWETTNTYLSQRIKDKCQKITMLARWISVWWDLEYTDDLTISRAFESRVDF